jgi:hypothetical protein
MSHELKSLTEERLKHQLELSLLDWDPPLLQRCRIFQTERLAGLWSVLSAMPGAYLAASVSARMLRFVLAGAGWRLVPAMVSGNRGSAAPRSSPSTRRRPVGARLIPQRGDFGHHFCVRVPAYVLSELLRFLDPISIVLQRHSDRFMT